MGNTWGWQGARDQCFKCVKPGIEGSEIPFGYAKHFEEFRVKRYKVGGIDRFGEHVDVATHASAKRCVAMLFYLNSVPVGGHTVFPQQGESFRPTKGYVTIFPPTWEYPHEGQPPLSNTKYIMSTYLHYG